MSLHGGEKEKSWRLKADWPWQHQWVPLLMPCPLQSAPVSRWHLLRLAPFVAEGILGVLAEHKLINGKEALRWKSLFLTLWMGPDFQTCSPVGNSWLRIHSIQRNGVFSSDQGSCSLNCRLSLVSSAVVLVGGSHLRCTDFEFFFSLPLYPYAFLLKLCFLFSAVQLFYSVRNIFHLFHDVVPTYHK